MRKRRVCLVCIIQSNVIMEEESTTSTSKESGSVNGLGDDSGALSPVDFESGDELMAENIQEADARTPFRRFIARFSPTYLCPPYCRSQRQYRVTGADPAEPPPKDHFHLVYICMLMAGAGFLFPWSSYISAIDYFFFLYHSQFPTVSEAIPVTYLLTTLLFSTVNVGLVGLFSIHSRIRFGYLMFSISLVFVPLLDIGINNCTVSTNVSYYLTLFSIVAVGIGSGIQQSSYYGLSSMLPRKYSQAVMAGESIAGLVVSVNRIITKLAIKSERLSSIIFFVISLLFILVCFVCHIYIQCSPFVKYHTRKCQKNRKKSKNQRKETSINGDDIGMESLPPDDADTNGTEGIPMKMRTVQKIQDKFGDDYESSGVSDDDDKVELIPGGVEAEPSQKQWSHTFIAGLRTRWNVVKQIWKLMVAIFANYFVTLLVFPGLVSEVQYCPIGDWMPIILIAVFNATDFVAKWLALLPCALKWSSFWLMVASMSRFVIVPVILLCIVPSPSSPVIGGVAVVVVAVMFNFVLGVTNGFLGSLPMINVSKEVRKDKDRELAGTIMTWVLLFALMLGSVLAYALTPLTALADHTQCSNTTVVFTNCIHGNTTLTR